MSGNAISFEIKGNNGEEDLFAFEQRNRIDVYTLEFELMYNSY